MAQIVKSCKFENGAEVNVRYTLYLNATELDALSELCCVVFGPEHISDVDPDVVTPVKELLHENFQLVLVRLFWTIFKSI